MENNSITVDLTAKDLFEFNIYHSYTHSQGIASVLFGLAAIGVTIAEFDKLTTGMFAVRILLGIAILVYIPCTLAMRARMAVKKGGSFDKPINITIGEDGVDVGVGEETNLIKWENVYRLKDRKNQFLIYTGRITALIIPKRCISGELIARIQEKYAQHADEA